MRNKLFKVLGIFALSVVAIPGLALSTAPADSLESFTPARALVLTERLEEIKETDISALPKAEKKALRKEVKEIKKEMKEGRGGVYLSVGAIIIIVLLLVLLL
jgi:hypothetical protein